MRDKAPQISVCIVTYRRDDVLIHSIKQLLNSSFKNFELLIVDNGASADLEHRLQSLNIEQGWELVQAPDNRGCANLNLLFERAVAPIIVCFDDDSFPRADCLGNAWRLFQERPELGMLGFKIHSSDSGEPWHDAWWNPDRSTPKKTVFCAGCGLAFRNDARLPTELCLFDIASQAHELSIAAEVLRLGYRVEFNPNCIAFHPDNTKHYAGEKAKGGNLNQLRFLTRYANFQTLSLLVMTHALCKLQGIENQLGFILTYLLKVKRRPLTKPIMNEFSEFLAWHIHPKLKFFRHPVDPG